jgi:hypothetical protein
MWIDGIGNLYYAGSYNITVTFGSTTLNYPGTAGYLAKSNGYVGIEEPSVNENGFNIYPNPAHNEFVVESLPGGQAGSEFGERELKIFDMMGRVVHEQRINNKQETINCHLKAGVYFLKVQSGAKVMTEKLVVE